MADEKKGMDDTEMERNNQSEFYSLVKAYREAYPAYKNKPAEAKKKAQALWTQLKDDYIMGLFLLFLINSSIWLVLMLWWVLMLWLIL